MEDHSEESWLLHKRISSLVLAQHLHCVCNRSVAWNVREMNINFTWPLSYLQKYQEIALLTFSHNCSQANVPTYCPPKFYHPFLSLGLFCTYCKQAELPSCCMSIPLLFSMVPVVQGWGRQGWSPAQLPLSCPRWAQIPPVQAETGTFPQQPKSTAKLERLEAISYFSSHRHDKTFPFLSTLSLA